MLTAVIALVFALAAIAVVVSIHREPSYRELQSLKGQGLGLRWFGFDAEAGLSEEPVDEAGSVLDALEPVLHDRGQLAR
jgi:hypothetical protein